MEDPTLVVEDRDGDGIADADDNCPDAANPGQGDFDQDGMGDVCDDRDDLPPPDKDLDGVADADDNCPEDANPEQADVDGDGIGDACDNPFRDGDGDGVADEDDNCPYDANPDQLDGDRDGTGDACEEVDPPTDTDGDGVIDAIDSCPDDANPDQLDTDRDGIGDVCDPLTDRDNDGIADDLDGCPDDYDPLQLDGNNNGMGDACDPLFERCDEPGDEDFNDLADCEDPACAEIERCAAVCGDGVVEGDETCDLGELNGAEASCCDAGCQLRAQGTVCREGSGDLCDLSESCNGVDPTCPADSIAAVGTVCRPARGGVCDANELCSGEPGLACPVDLADCVASPDSLSTDPPTIGSSLSIALTGLAEPGAQVAVYGAANCMGTPLASVTAGVDGAFRAPINLPMAPSHQLSALARRDGRPSPCSAAVTYTWDSTPPAAPNSFVLTPDETGHAISPRLDGSAEPGARVEISLSSTCMDAPAAQGLATAAGTFSLPVNVRLMDTSLLYASAVDAAGNRSSCVYTGKSYAHTNTLPLFYPRSFVAHAGRPLTIPSFAPQLLANPGAEEDYINGELPSWIEILGDEWRRGGTGSVVAWEGSYFFYAGTQDAAELWQEVDLTARSAEIDAGQLGLSFTAWVLVLGNIIPRLDTDKATLGLDFLGADGQELLAAYDTPVIENELLWNPYTLTAYPPIGSRFARVRLYGVRNPNVDEDIDSFFDGLRLEPYNLLSGARDPDGDDLQITAISTPTLGAIVSTPDGYVYTPRPDARGVETLQFTLSDGHGALVQIPVRIRVNALPRLLPDLYATLVNQPLILSAGRTPNLLTNPGAEASPAGLPGWTAESGSWAPRTSSPSPYSGVACFGATTTDRSTLTQSIDLDAAAPPGGTLQIESFFTTADGQDAGRLILELLDDANNILAMWDSNNYFSPAWVRIQSQLTIPPGATTARVRLVAQNGSSASNDAVFDDVYLGATGFLANDTDPDNEALTLVSVGNPSTGSLQALPDGTWRFTPPPNFTGFVTVPYTVSDASGALVTGQITINVNP